MNDDEPLRLRDFVAEAIKQVIDGVATAQHYATNKKAIMNPSPIRQSKTLYYARRFMIECRHEYSGRSFNSLPILTGSGPRQAGLAYVFATLDRKPSRKECLDLHVKYFESHYTPLVPYGQVLFVDLRPAFRKPFNDVTPTFHVIDEIPKDATPPESGSERL